MLQTTTLLLIGAFVFAGLMSVADLTNVFGQEYNNNSTLQDRVTDIINNRVEHMTNTFLKFGFTDFEYNPYLHKITMSSYNNTAIIDEDLAGTLVEFYGFEMIAFYPHEHGMYIVAQLPDSEGLIDLNNSAVNCKVVDC